MSDTIISGIKTAVQAGLAFLVVWLSERFGIDVGSLADGAELFIVAILTGLVGWLTNKLGQKWPWINKVISLGSSKATAVYPTIL